MANPYTGLNYYNPKNTNSFNDLPTTQINQYNLYNKPDAKIDNNPTLRQYTYPGLNNGQNDTTKINHYPTVSVGGSLIGNVTNSTTDSRIIGQNIDKLSSALNQKLNLNNWKLSEIQDIHIRTDFTALDPLISNIISNPNNHLNFDFNKYSSYIEIKIPNFQTMDSFLNFSIETIFKSIVWNFQSHRNNQGIPSVGPFCELLSKILSDQINYKNLLRSNPDDLSTFYKFLYDEGKLILNFHKAKLIGLIEQKNIKEVLLETIDHMENCYKIPFKLHLYISSEYTKYKKGNFSSSISLIIIWTKDKVYVIFAKKEGDNSNRNIKIEVKQKVNENEEISAQSMVKIKDQINILLGIPNVDDQHLQNATAQIMNLNGSASSKINYLLNHIILYRSPSSLNSSDKKKLLKENDLEPTTERKKDKSRPIQSEIQQKKLGIICMFCGIDESKAPLMFNETCVTQVGCEARFHQLCLEDKILYKNDGRMNNLFCLICKSPFKLNVSNQVINTKNLKDVPKNILSKNISNNKHPNNQICDINHNHIKQQDIILSGVFCEHNYYKECLRKYVEEKINSNEIKDLNKIKCPLCESFIMANVITVNFPELETLFHTKFGVGAKY